MEPTAAVDALRASVLTALRDLRGRDGMLEACFFVPGRIEVLGKHTDYAGGRSLLAAVDRGFVIASAHRRDDRIRILDARTGERFETDALGGGGRAEAAPGVRDLADVRTHPAMNGPTPAWAIYPLTVLRRCARNFPSAAGGADIVFASDLPQASGLSSSSALTVAMFLALDAVRGMSQTAEYGAAIASAADLAGYLGAVENGMSFSTLAGEPGVGTMGGSEDHTAILCARPGRLVQYSFAPVRAEGDVPVPAGWTFAVGSSGVRAEKTGAALEHYNRLSSATQRLVQLWRSADAGDAGTLGDILARDADASLRLREIVRSRDPDRADELLGRLAQFIAESEQIVPAAAAALARGDLNGFAELVRRSQHYAVEVLRNQVPETNHLVATALELGAVAASAFGAGFGGSVWALVPTRDAPDFIGAWRDVYVRQFSTRQHDACFFITPAAAPATRLKGD